MIAGAAWVARTCESDESSTSESFAPHPRQVFPGQAPPNPRNLLWHFGQRHSASCKSHQQNHAMQGIWTTKSKEEKTPCPNLYPDIESLPALIFSMLTAAIQAITTAIHIAKRHAWRERNSAYSFAVSLLKFI
jgi:hypothetical protein